MGSIEGRVIRALHLGDVLRLIPSIRALRLAGPRSRIVVIGLPCASEFAARYPHYLNDFVEIPGWPGIPERESTEESPARSDPARWAPIDRSRHIAPGGGLRGGPTPLAAEVIDAALSRAGAAA